MITLLASVLTWLLLWRLVPVLRQRLLDLPNARSAHAIPTPRGGGVAFVLVGSAAVGLLGNGIPLICLPLALVGLLDDRLNLPVALRYGVQIATALVLVLISPLTQRAGTLPMLLVLATGLLLVIAATAVINFTNFMDGLDGLVTACMAVVFSAVAWTSPGSAAIWPMVGSLLAFLTWNWSPARVFMGDVGSTFLGALFAGLVLQAPSWGDALGLMLVATPLLGDACVCVPRRLLAGQPIFEAHRLHLFQRLHQAGWSHARVTSLYLAATAVLGMALQAGGWRWVIGLAAVELVLGVWLDQRVAIPFAVAANRAAPS